MITQWNGNGNLTDDKFQEEAEYVRRSLKKKPNIDPVSMKMLNVTLIVTKSMRHTDMGLNVVTLHYIFLRK